MYYLYGKINRGHGICPLYGGCPLLGESVIRGFTVILAIHNVQGSSSLRVRHCRQELGGARGGGA